MVVEVSRINQFELLIQTDKASLAELKGNLSQWFSQYAPNFIYDPRFKRHVWDGKIYFFDRKNCILPSGLLGELKRFSKAMGYDLKLEPGVNINSFSGLTPSEVSDLITDFVDGLGLPPELEVRDYQYKYLAKFIQKNHILAESPTASGKSLVIYMAIRYALSIIDKNSKCLIVVPTTQLVEQMYRDFESYRFNSEKYCHRVYSGSPDGGDRMNTDKRIVISTWQSLYKRPISDFISVNAIFADEVHQFAANKVKNVIRNCSNAWLRMGTTGTLGSNDPCSAWTLAGMFSDPVKYIDTIELMDRGYISKLKIEVINLLYSDEDCRSVNGLPYPAEMNFIDQSKNRADFLSSLVKKISDSGENALVLFKRIEFGKRTVTDLEKLGIKVLYVDGSVGVSDRENVRDTMELGNGVVAVCSYGTFSTGINIKNLHNLVFASTTKAEIKVLQSIGRSLRLHPSKDFARVWDIVDNMKWKKKNNYAMNHYFERSKIYSANGFTIEHIEKSLI